jgi:putative DNA primase/helicase
VNDDIYEYLYRGFIQLKDKEAIEKFKDRDDLSTFNTVRRYAGYAGVLAPGVLLVDVDDFEKSEIVLRMVDDLNIQCCVVETGRGKHFLFRDPDLPSNKTKTNTAIGITVDIKLGTRNSYQVLKHNGVKRPWIRRSEQVDTLPFWLMPIKHNTDFSKLGEGDGRNQSLFNYILTLQGAGFTKEEIRETIHLINKYILPDPLPEREINTILRDEAFKKQSFFKGSTFLHDRFAQYIMRENHIIKIDNVLHVFKDGVYSDRVQDIEAVMIKHLPQLNQAKRRETLAYLDIIAENQDPAPANLIALENGIYDLSSDKIIDFSPDIIIKNRIPVTFDPDAYDKTTDQTLNKISCGDKEVRALLEEMIGYLLFRRNELRKAFILTGTGQNGKSTLLDMIKHFLGPDNYSSLALEELGHRFKTAEIFGKLANIGDDIDSEYIQSNAVFKKLVTGETVNAERKGKDPFEFNNYGKLIFSANEMPRINDRTDGLISRLIIIPFNAKFTAQDPDFDPFIKDKLLTDRAMSYLLNLGLTGLKRVLQRKQFTMPEVVRQEMQLYESINNPVLAFIEDGGKIENEPTKDVYLKYNAWCHQNGLRPLSQIQFSREVCRKLGMETKVIRVDGKLNRIFIQN